MMRMMIVWMEKLGPGSRVKKAEREADVMLNKGVVLGETEARNNMQDEGITRLPRP